MADSKWTKYTGGEKYPVWNEEKKVGEVLEGTLIGRKSVKTTKGDSMLFNVEQKNGEKVSLWGTALLNRFFEELPLGTEVQIKYLGKQKSEKNGNSYHGYDLAYNKETMPAVEVGVESEDIPF